LKAYSKRFLDSFCRWERISIPYGDGQLVTTIGQLNFFKWAIENKILEYIEEHYEEIEQDMNNRNSSSSKRNLSSSTDISTESEESVVAPIKSDGKTRKKRQELSVSASKCIKKEMVHIVVSFDK
jgi:protein required for attachment to host cells